jgi:hypothetical protein
LAMMGHMAAFRFQSRTSWLSVSGDDTMHLRVAHRVAQGLAVGNVGAGGGVRATHHALKWERDSVNDRPPLPNWTPTSSMSG